MNRPIRLKDRVLMVVALVFCFAGMVAAQEAQKIDACALLTRAEIKAALGQEVGEGKLNAKANPAVGVPCEYKVGDYGVFSILVKAVGPGEATDKVVHSISVGWPTIVGRDKDSQKGASVPAGPIFFLGRRQNWL